MKKKKNILFTFDYELFLGKRSGSVDKCLILPTEKILDILNRYNMKCIFFIDTLYLIRLKEKSKEFNVAKDDEKKIHCQIQHIIKLGHYVFLHIHPHWLDAQYLQEINQWELEDFSNYRLSNIPVIEREKLFSKSVNLLNEILIPINKNYFCCGFRAGGWCIQPFEDFKPLFEKFNIKYDFSVIPGFAKKTTAQFFDFSRIPYKKIYCFEDDISTEVPAGQFTEFTISAIHISLFRKFLNKLVLKILSEQSYGDGHAVFPEKLENKPITPSNTLRKPEWVSIEELTWAKLPLYLNFIKQNDYMQFISHPKMLMPHNLSTFEKFLAEVFSKYEIETDFRKFSL